MAVLDQLPHWVNPYPDWIRVGMALHDYYEGDYEGLYLWEEFSSPGDTFQDGVCAEKWRSFRHTREDGVTFATLVHEVTPPGTHQGMMFDFPEYLLRWRIRRNGHGF